MMYSHKAWKRSQILEVADLHSTGGMDAEIERLTSTTDRTPFSKSGRQRAREYLDALCAWLNDASIRLAELQTKIDGLPRP